MRSMKSLFWLGAVCVAAATGCTAPISEGVSQRAVDVASKSPTTTPEMTTLRTPCQTMAPTYMLRIKDADGTPYWPDPWFKSSSPDGYTVPFPTPWITNNSNLEADKLAGLDYEPDVYAYEHDQWGLPSSLGYEYLVKVVIASSCVNPITGGPGQCLKGYSDNGMPGGKEWFAVPFTQWTDLTSAQAYAAQYASASTVQSHIFECVTIVDGTGAYGGFLTPVESDIFVDVHDPHNPPLH